MDSGCWARRSDDAGKASGSSDRSWARSKHAPATSRVAGNPVSLSPRCNRRPEVDAAWRRSSAFRTPSSSDELVQSPEVDAVVIGNGLTPLAGMLAALAAGKHVLCEARMAMNAAEAHQMLAARAHPELVTQVVPAPFSLRVDQTVQELIADGTLGDLRWSTCAAWGDILDRVAAALATRPAPSGLNVPPSALARDPDALGRNATRCWRGRVLVPERVDPVRAARDRRCLTTRRDRRPENGAQASYQISAVEGLAGPSGITSTAARAPWFSMVITTACRSAAGGSWLRGHNPAGEGGAGGGRGVHRRHPRRAAPHHRTGCAT